MTLREKLFAIQNEIRALVKTQENPFFKSKYFDINQVITQLKPLLKKNKLVVLQPLSQINGTLALETWVLDVEGKDGDDLKVITLLPEGLDAQKSGSAITYFRRYALQSLFLLEAEDDDAEDDDANVASAKVKVSKADQTTFNANVKANPTYRKTYKPEEGEADPNAVPDFNK